MFSCRSQLAKLMNIADPLRIILCKNATEALNIAILGLMNQTQKDSPWVLTTAGEHNSVLRPLYLLQRTGRIKLEIIPCDWEGRVDHDKWNAGIDRLAPHLVTLNHASNVTGAVNDVAVLLNYAREKKCLTLLDASQSLGLLDIDADSIGADIIAFTGHKYLLGPAGTGGMYIKEGVEIEPVFSGGTGIRSDLKEMPTEIPLRLEPGTPALSLFAGLLHSIKWQQKNPLPFSRMEALARKLEQGLLENGADVNRVSGKRTFIISFRLPGWNLDDIGYLLDRNFGILCRTGLHCAPLVHTYLCTAPRGTIRFSISRFTSEEEIDYTIKCIEELRNEAG